MNSAARLSKLAQLRVKTDQELSLILDTSLESALNLLDSGEPQRARAEQAYAEAVKLLPKVDDLHERRRLKIKLAQVRENLTRLAASDESRVQAACLWQPQKLRMCTLSGEVLATRVENT